MTATKARPRYTLCWWCNDKFEEESPVSMCNGVDPDPVFVDPVCSELMEEEGWTRARSAATEPDVDAGGELAAILGTRKPTKKASTARKPTHYKVISVSMYTPDLARLNEKVAALKRHGLFALSKSELIRIALDQLDVEKLAEKLLG